MCFCGKMCEIRYNKDVVKLQIKSDIQGELL